MRKQSGFGLVSWLVTLAILGAGGWFGWSQYKKKSNKPIEYKTAAITRGDIVQQVTANGQITPVRNVAVGTQVSGIIQEVHVDFNSRVTNGQLIARIDPSSVLQNITSAEAEIANAKASLEYARLNYNRAKELNASELLSKADYEKTYVELQQAEASLIMRQASLKRLNVDLERTSIFAPIDGVVISRNIELGQTVASSFNTPTLFMIANDLAKMRIEAMVSEADIGGVEEGQKVTFTVDAFQGRTFRGTIQQLRFAAVTNQNVVNYVSVVEVNNSDLKLRPGMTAYANIITSEKTNVLRIPSAALTFRPPTNAVVRGVTNTLSSAPGGAGTRLATTSSNAPAGRGGGGGGDEASREERRRRFESMSPEERERMMARFREGRGGGAGGGRGGSRAPDAPVSRTVYTLAKEKNDAGDEIDVLKPITVKVGSSDGVFAEVVEGLNEADLVVTGINLPLTAVGIPPGTTTPFGGPRFGGGGRGGGGGGRGGGR